MPQHPLGASCWNSAIKGVSITYAREITIFQTEVRKECYALLKLLIFVIHLITEKPDRTINYSIDRICKNLKLWATFLTSSPWRREQCSHESRFSILWKIFEKFSDEMLFHLIRKFKFNCKIMVKELHNNYFHDESAGYFVSKLLI